MLQSTVPRGNRYRQASSAEDDGGSRQALKAAYPWSISQGGQSIHHLYSSPESTAKQFIALQVVVTFSFPLSLYNPNIVVSTLLRSAEAPTAQKALGNGESDAKAR